MNYIGLSTKLFDLEGAYILKYKADESTLVDFGRRLSRVATLDSDVYVSDFGYSDGDRNFTLVLLEESKDLVEKLIYLAKNHSVLTLCTAESAFLVSIQNVRINNKGRLILSMMSRGSA